MDRFVHYDDVTKVLAEGETKSSVVLRGGLQVDLRVVPLVSFGAALHYFTGSKAHNIAVRLMGVKRKLKVNEYGVFRGKKMIAGRTEEEVYKLVRPALYRARAAGGPGRAPGRGQGPAAAPRPARGHQGRPPRPHQGHRRPLHRRRDGRGREEAGLRVPGHHRSFEARDHGPRPGRQAAGQVRSRRSTSSTPSSRASRS